MFKVGLTPNFIGFMFRTINVCHIHSETIFCHANTRRGEPLFSVLCCSHILIHFTQMSIHIFKIYSSALKIWQYRKLRKLLILQHHIPPYVPFCLFFCSQYSMFKNKINLEYVKELNNSRLLGCEAGSLPTSRRFEVY
jgi:hypothetical protein